MKQPISIDILERFIENKCTPSEKALVKDWYQSSESGHDYVSGLNKLEELDLEEKIYNQILHNIENAEKSPAKSSIKRIWPRVAVAALVLIVCSAGLYFFKPNTHTLYAVNNKRAANTTHLIVPGRNKAILTLANGTKIALTDAANGVLARQQGTVITKTKNGLVYNAQNPSMPGDAVQAIAYNIIQTPKGGQYQVNLPDGTKVWLNAFSSLKFPVSFSANERRVELSGEAYFEVAHNAEKPFKVVSKGQQVEVLGTHFNIYAYNDEPAIQTTLLQGAVKLSHASHQVLLKPNQQAILGDKNFDVRNVNANEAIAWKNGYFLFKDEHIQSVMKKIARWYDVDIEYRGDVFKKRLGGTISRFGKISDVLSTIQLTQSVHFTTNGRTIIVTP